MSVPEAERFAESAVRLDTALKLLAEAEAWRRKPAIERARSLIPGRSEWRERRDLRRRIHGLAPRPFRA